MVADFGGAGRSTSLDIDLSLIKFDLQISPMKLESDPN
jgi:hypothetical protein